MLADRAQLLAAAERAVASIGPDVTMDQIAAEAQVTKPILYRTIGDKAAVVDSLSDVFVERIAQSVDGSVIGQGDPKRDFTASLRAYFTTVDADRNLYLFVNSPGQQPGPLRARIDRAAEQLIEMFCAAQAHPGSERSATTWGHAVVGAMQAVTLMWIDTERDDGRTIDDITADLTRLLWPGMVGILGLDSQGSP